MLTQSKASRVWRLIAIVFMNPYQPPSVPGEANPSHHDDATFVVPLRFDPLSVAALVASLLSTAAICLYHTAGTGVIGDPILFSLASKSIAWIPVYRMATPLLILFMPQRCRSTFAVFFLVLGILCCLNDFPGHFYGIYLVQSPLVLLVALLLSFALVLMQFFYDTFRARHRLRSIMVALGWFAVLLSVQALFYAASVFM